MQFLCIICWPYLGSWALNTQLENFTLNLGGQLSLRMINTQLVKMTLNLQFTNLQVIYTPDPGGETVAQLDLLDRGHHVQDGVQLLGHQLGRLVSVVTEVHLEHACVSHLFNKLVLVKVLK